MAQSKLEIIINGVDNASDDFKKIGDASKRAGEEAKKSGLNFDKMKAGLKNAAVAGGIAIGAITAVGAAVKGLADHTLDYALQVDDLSRAIGATPEQASKLIQVADDVGVSYQQLTSALEAGIRKGVEPTVENLAKMSDEYLAIQPGIERTEYLMENFGRTGNDLARIMELGSDKIAEMGDSIEGTGRLMTDEGIQRAKEYRDALDDMGDSVDDLQLNIGMKLIPKVGALAKLMAELTSLDTENWFQQGADASANFINKFFGIEQQVSDAERQIIAYYKGMGRLPQAHEVAAASGKQAGGELVKAWHEVEAAIDGTGKTTENVVSNVVGIWDAAERASRNAASAVDDYYGAINTGIGSQIESQMEALEFKLAGGGTLEALSQRINEKIVSGEITEQQGLDYLGGLFVAEQDLQVDLDNITAEQAAENIASTLNVSLEEANALLQSAQDRTNYLNGLTMQMTIDVAVTGRGAELLLGESGLGGGAPITPPSGGGGSGQSGGVQFRAAGGPVASGQLYLVGERGPELFAPGTSGAIVNNQETQQVMGGTSFNAPVSFVFPNVTNQRDMEAWFNNYIRKNRNSGAFAAGL